MDIESEKKLLDDVYELYDILIKTPVYADKFDDLMNLFIKKRDELFDAYFEEIKNNKLDFNQIPKSFFDKILFYYKPTKTKKDVLNFYAEALKQDGLNLEYVPDSLKFVKFDSDRKIKIKCQEEYIKTTLSEIAVRQNGLALKFVPYKKIDRYDYKSVAEIAVKQNKLASEFVHEFYFIKLAVKT